MHKVKYPAQFQYLDEIRDFVGEVASRGGFDGKEVYSIQLAADEAASNIIEHAYAGVSNGEIEVSCEVKHRVLTIMMRDHGRTFDPGSVAPPDVKADLSKRKIGGLGIYLMRKLMDDVRYESIPGKGNLLTLQKRKA